MPLYRSRQRASKTLGVEASGNAHLDVHDPRLVAAIQVEIELVEQAQLRGVYGVLRHP
jgi:hypothetical protein